MLEILGYLLTGIAAGLLGGLLGIGGGAVMVPSLNLLFGRPMQLAIAASLTCMIFLSISSAYGHWRNRYILRNVVAGLIPMATAGAIAGVFLGTRVPVWILYLLFAAFLLYSAFDNTRKILARVPPAEPLGDFEPKNRWTIPLIALPMGLSCGMLGIGGGVIAVPALHTFLKLPLKNAIANSAATILFSASVAAFTKLYAIHGMEVEAARGAMTLHWWDPVLIALLMAPTALLFARLGAHLTKVFPTHVVRAVFVVLLVWAGYKYAVKFYTSYQKAHAGAAVEAPAEPRREAANTPSPGG